MFYIYALLLILVVIIFLINFQPYKSSVTHYATIDITFFILLSLCYTSFNIRNPNYDIKRAKISLLYLRNRSVILLHTNHLHNLLNASVDVLEKEMEWTIHNENEKTIQP